MNADQERVLSEALAQRVPALVFVDLRRTPAAPPGGAGRRARSTLREAYERLAGPERARIDAELPDAEQRLTELEGQDLAHLRFEIAQPEVLLRLQHLDLQIALATYDLALERQALDGIAPDVFPLPQPHRGVERELGAPDLGIGLGL